MDTLIAFRQHFFRNGMGVGWGVVGGQVLISEEYEGKDSVKRYFDRFVWLESILFCGVV